YAARRVEGEVAGRVAADVEVLMEPAVRRHEYATLVPRDDDFFVPFLPHHRVSLAGRDDDHHPRAVAMGLLVGAGWEHRHVGGDRRARELDEDRVAACAPRL